MEGSYVSASTRSFDDPLAHAPIFAFFLFLISAQVVVPPTNPISFFLWRNKIPVWLVLAGSICSGVFLFSISSVNSILIPGLIVNYSLAPSTFSVFRGVAPLWLALYKPEATKLFMNFRQRVHFFLRVFLTLCGIILLIALAVWVYYIYSYVFLAPPIKSPNAFFNVAASAMFGFYVIYACLSIMMTAIAQVVVCIIHELQLELLLSAIRKRSRDFRLAAIVPSKFVRPSLYQRLLDLFRDPTSTQQEIRPNPASYSIVPSFDRPLTNIFDMIKNVQDTFDWTAYKFLPMFLVNNYIVLSLNFIFLAVAVYYEVYFGLIYMAVCSIGIPAGLCCNAILNQACFDFEIRLEQCLSMYTSEEQAQILAAVRTRPLKYRLGGVTITWTTIVFISHLLLIPPIIGFVLWLRSGKPFL